MKVPEALALIRPGRNLTRNNQVDTEARKQRTGKTINPLRQTLIATTHFRQCKQAGDYGKPRQRFHDDQGKDPQRAPVPTLSPTNNENTEPK